MKHNTTIGRVDHSNVSCRYVWMTILLWFLLSWLPGNAGEAQEQFVTVNLAHHEAINESVFEELQDVFPAAKAGQRSLGTAAIFSYLHKSRAQTKSELLQFLSLAERFEIPVVVQLDGEQWWGQRPDLWNWWDPSRPGYDPENCQNVEWSGWGPEYAIKIAWRNWGRQIRVLPPPNFMSRRYRQACHKEMRVLVPLIVKWWEKLPTEKKRLLIGIKLGWESAIGVNSFYYPNGNALLDRDEDQDPQTGLKADQLPDRGVTAIGYAAVTAAGLATGGELKESHVAEIVRRHLDDLCALSAELGVPRARLFTHVAGWKQEELLYDAALNTHSCPGWSFYKYARDPAKDRGVHRALQKSDAPYWAAVEWLLAGRPDTQTWQTAIQRTLSDPKCRYMCIYNWGSIKNNPAAIDAIGRILHGQLPAGHSDTVH